MVSFEKMNMWILGIRENQISKRDLD